MRLAAGVALPWSRERWGCGRRLVLGHRTWSRRRRLVPAARRSRSTSDLHALLSRTVQHPTPSRTLYTTRLLSTASTPQQPISDLRSDTCYSAICHSTQVNTLYLNSQQSRRVYSIYLPGRDRKSSWFWVVSYYDACRDGLPARRQSPIQVVSTW